MNTPLTAIVSFAFCLLLIVFFFASCKTYTIPVESFKKQFEQANAKGIKSVTTVGPYGDHADYNTINMDVIVAMDKQGREIALKVSPSLEIRFTHSGRKTTFYFDLLRYDGDTIDGGRSRFMPALRKKISIATVSWD